MQIKRAVISVFDKAGVVDLARGLKTLGVEILSTGGTAKALRDNNIEVIDIADYTGSPEILDGRLKTLHPMVHGGILGMRGNEKHRKEMAANNIEPIDMIVVNLYPFEETVAKPDCTLEDAIENIDIGGPTMLRAAAKNYQDVAVVVDPSDYGKILKELKNSNGELGKDTTFALAQKVFALTARYDGAICNYLSATPSPLEEEGRGEGKISNPPLPLRERAGVRGDPAFPAHLALTYQKAQDLRYGENPHQKAAFYKEHKIIEPCVAGMEQLHGKELSYNNIMDTDAAIEIVKEFAGEIFVAILKHTNPCGAATSDKSLVDAFNKAKATDPVSAFGGIVGLSREVDEATASAITETFFEVVVAPGFSGAALKALEKKKNMRLLKLPGLKDYLSPSTEGRSESMFPSPGGRSESMFPSPGGRSESMFPSPGGRGEGRGIALSSLNTRKVVGGLLVQERDLGSVDVRTCNVATKRPPTDEEYKALAFAWKICKHVKSNAIVYASADQLMGVGAGQMSRVDSAKIARMKMGEMLGKDAKDAGRLIVCASDAFFPFRDGIDAAADAGATAIIQPGGSKRDDEGIEAANEHGIAMIFTGMRHFKH